MLKEALIFTGGVGLGATGTYLLIKKKYEGIAQNEIDEVKSLYLSKCRKIDAVNKLNEEKEKMTSIAVNNNYYKEEPSDGIEPDEDLEAISSKEEEWEREREAPVEHPSEPYTITPYQFAYENRHYDKLTLLYYPADKVLLNESEDIQESIDESIGEDALTKFGEFEEEVAYVRNDRLGIDYEVLLQPENEHYISEDSED